MRSAGRIKAQKNKDNVWKSWMLFLGKGLRRFVQYNEISFPSETTENQWKTQRKYTPVALRRLAVLALVIAMDHVVLAKFAMSICLPLIPTLQFIHMELSKQHIRSPTSIERQDLKRSHNPISQERIAQRLVLERKRNLERSRRSHLD
jgi:hypothetical protein